jgi:hypothetical protein
MDFNQASDHPAIAPPTYRPGWLVIVKLDKRRACEMQKNEQIFSLDRKTLKIKT